MTMGSQRLVLGVATAALVSACSVFLGWSDLQDGKEDAAAGDRDASPPGTSGGPGEDGGPGGEGGPGPGEEGGAPDAGGPRIPCPGAGDGTCSGGLGCCVRKDDTRFCTTQAACIVDEDQRFFGCDRTAACKTGVCCWKLTAGTTTCTAICEDDQLCDPAGDDCGGGACQAGGPIIEGYYKCP